MCYKRGTLFDLCCPSTSHCLGNQYSIYTENYIHHAIAYDHGMLNKQNFSKLQDFRKEIQYDNLLKFPFTI
jgi:hypothetical protein